MIVKRRRLMNYKQKSNAWTIPFDQSDITLTRKAVRNYQVGGSVSDQEIAAGIKVLGTVTEVLFALGERYFLPAKELRHVWHQLRSFKSARELEK
jgi:hypothetical protein